MTGMYCLFRRTGVYYGLDEGLRGPDRESVRLELQSIGAVRLDSLGQ